MTTEPDSGSDPERWLDAQAKLAAGAFARSSVWEIAGTAAALAQWAAIAALIGGLLDPKSTFPWATSAALVGMAVFAGVCRAEASRAARIGRRRIAAGLRRRLVRGLVPDTVGTTAPLDPAAAAAVAAKQVDDVADYLATAVPVRLAAGWAMALVFVLIAVVHWPVALMLAGATAIVPLNMRLAGLSAQDASGEQLRRQRALSRTLLEALHGMPTLRAIGAVKRFREGIIAASRDVERASKRVLARAFLSSLVMDAVVTFAIAVCATYVGLTLLGYVIIPIAQPVNLVSGLLVLMACPMYFMPLRRAAAGYHLRDVAVAAAAMLAPLEPIEATADTSGVRVGSPSEDHTMPERHGSEHSGPGITARCRGENPLAEIPEVRTERLAFTWPSAQSPVFGGADFVAQAGRWTAVVGPSGAGKTTLLSLLAGLRTPTVGRVVWRCGGRDLVPDIRAASWIGQSTMIVRGTIAENIRLGRADASDAEVFAAAKTAGLEDLLARRGASTRLDDSGSGVSAGQARRIAIARAVLKGSGLWLLDEPTAHLDAHTEADVLRALRSATRGSSVIAVTHSPRLAELADDVWEVSGGALTRTGTKAEESDARLSTLGEATTEEGFEARLSTSGTPGAGAAVGGTARATTGDSG